jgi:malonyl-CoA O-methyltransferase
VFDKQKIKASFSRHAFEYDHWASFQRNIGEKLLLQLDNPFTHILDLGCGTGWFLKKLQEQYPQAKLTALDLAPEMLQHSLARLGSAKIEWIEADMDEYIYGPERFDLIFSNLALQWSENLEALLQQLALSLKPRGELHFSVLGKHTLKELQQTFAKHFPQQQERLHPFHSAQQIRLALSSANFQSIFWAEEWIERAYPSSKHLLQSLKHLGAGSGTKTPIPNHPKAFKKFLEDYDQQYQTSATEVQATYEVFYIRAIK